VSRRLEPLLYKHRLKELGLFNPEKRRLERHLIASCWYSKEVYRKDREGPFTRECSERMRIVLDLARTGLIFTGLQEGAQPGGGG